MSVLPAELQGALVQLLKAAQSPDNALRSQAEEQLNNDWIPNRPDVFLMGLVEQMQISQEQAVWIFSFTPRTLVNEGLGQIVCCCHVQTASLEDQETGQ